MTAMVIGYDQKLNKLTVQCPVWANDVLNGFMSRRWSKAKRAWLVPLMRRNVDFLESQLIPMGAAVDEAARAAVNKARDQYGNMAKPNPFPAWYKFKTEPRKHQQAALARVYGLPAFGLIMGMGTGKSKLLIDIACALRMEDVMNRLLIICKRSLRRNWVEQFELHAPLPVDITLPETGAMKAFDRWMGVPADLKVAIIGMESLSQGGMIDLARKFVLGGTKNMCAIDESHMIATPNSIRTERCIELGRMAEFRAILTGTAIKDGPLNFFAPFEFLDPNIIGIGDYYAFRNRYAIMGGYRERRPDGSYGDPKQVVGYQNLDELIDTIAPYVFQITKEEALPHLPKKGYERRDVPLTKEQLDLIKQIKAKRSYKVDGKDVEIKNVLEQALRMHQVCGGWTVDKIEVNLVDGRIKQLTKPVRVIPPERNPKLLELKSILEQLRGRSVIIWAAYIPEIDDILELVKTEFPGQGVVEMTGRVSEAQQDWAKNIFQQGERWMVGNVMTGGTGFTLTACEYMIYYNNTNKFTEREQSEDRAHRDGLTHPVTYIDLVSEGCNIEQVILDAFKERKDLAQYIAEQLRKRIDPLQ